MKFKTEYSYDYCWHMAIAMDQLFDHQKSFFWPLTVSTATMISRHPHPAIIERNWYNDPTRKLLMKIIMHIENIYIPKITITMSKDEFDKSGFNSRLTSSLQ